jgi:hypothetical protein
MTRRLPRSSGTIEAATGLPGTGLDARLSAFFDAFAALSNDPTSAVARDSVMRQGIDLSQAFHNLVGQLDASAQDADTAVRASVDEVNSLTTELASLNARIATSAFGTETLRDRQGVILQRLGALADVSVLQRQDGGVDVTLASGRAIVIGETAYALKTSGPGTATISLEGVDVTSELERRPHRRPAARARCDRARLHHPDRSARLRSRDRGQRDTRHWIRRHGRGGRQLLHGAGERGGRGQWHVGRRGHSRG